MRDFIRCGAGKSSKKGVKEMKQHTRRKRKTAAIAAVLCAMLLSAGTVYADTDGTEIQVEQPSQLEIQLGPAWAGVEFQLRMDAGIYPGVITVDETGVLRTEIGGGTSYILSSMNSSVAVPTPDETTQAPATTEPSSEALELAPESWQSVDNPSDEVREQEPEAEVAGIPIQHLILFGGGLLLAIGSLIALRIVKNRNTDSRNSYDDDNEDLPN